MPTNVHCTPGRTVGNSSSLLINALLDCDLIVPNDQASCGYSHHKSISSISYCDVGTCASNNHITIRGMHIKGCTLKVTHHSSIQEGIWFQRTLGKVLIRGHCKIARVYPDLNRKVYFSIYICYVTVPCHKVILPPSNCHGSSPSSVNCHCICGTLCECHVLYCSCGVVYRSHKLQLYWSALTVNQASWGCKWNHFVTSVVGILVDPGVRKDSKGP